MASAFWEKIDFNFNNEEISKIIQTYSKESGQKFVVDSTVRGKVTILNPEKITKEEAKEEAPAKRKKA